MAPGTNTVGYHLDWSSRLARMKGAGLKGRRVPGIGGCECPSQTQAWDLPTAVVAEDSVQNAGSPRDEH